MLAKTLSEMDNRVLLIDADLRKPQLHTRLGINNILGLSNILTNNCEPKEAIQYVRKNNNFAVITSGLYLRSDKVIKL